MQLISTIGAILIMAMMLPALADLWTQGFIETQKKQAAEHLNMVIKASGEYVRTNQTQLLSTTTPNSGTSVSIAKLKTDGHLLDGFREQNLWKQSYQIHIRQPKADHLQAIILTIDGIAQNAKFASTIIPSTAMLAGGAAGFIPTGDITGQAAGTLHGAGGGYIVDLALLGIASPGAGHLGGLSSFDESALGQDFLYRVAVPGQEELNAMQTELDMTGNAIRNVEELQFTTRTISTEACATLEEQGRMFLDPEQGLYLCRDYSLEMIGDSGNSVLMQSATLASSGTRIIKPICPPSTNTIPQIFVSPAIAEVGANSPSINAFQTWATSLSDTEWQVHLRLLTSDKSLSFDNSGWVYPAQDYGRIMVMTMCAKDLAVAP